MNPVSARTRLAIAAVTTTIAVVIAGCASVAVTDDALQRNTATSLSLAPGSFTISNRQDSGVQTNYNVTAQDGRQYACYVTGTVSVVGRVVSDAVCRPMAKSAAGTAPATSATPAATCNALLKAAGRC